MKVITLDNEALTQACLRLEEAARKFTPDLIVGIATGGEEIASRMFKAVPHVSVRCRRPGSENKDRNPGLFRLIRRLPVGIRDFLRIIELRWGSSMRVGETGKRNVEVSPEAAAEISRASRILVVDDAIDSGSTISAVLRAIKRDTVAIAVLTVTTPRPILRPDYTLFDNRTLIRFPWSKDFNPED